MVLTTNDTIAAISTPPGSGGIGVVRISGPDAKRIAEKIFRPTAAIDTEIKGASSRMETLRPFIPRNMLHGYIAMPGKDEVLDEVLLVFMPAPNSYTREDVVEIQAHAGAVVLKEILDLVLRQGARLAEAGEFTRRAYLNGRIDLSQAEGIIDVIQAKTETSLKIASRLLEGRVGKIVGGIKAKIQDVHAAMEADIEFSEDIEDDEKETGACSGLLKEVIGALEDILNGYKTGHLLRDGLRLTIVGKVNVGKSSLMNRFLRRERAIVTEIPGTTRDHIEETLDIFGLPVILVDTAGWRDTADPVERIGIERTRELADAADLILFMVDADRGILPEDYALYERVQNKEKILVVNKEDLLGASARVPVPKGWTFNDVVYTSVKFDAGVDRLKDRIYRFGTEGWDGCECGIVANLRQKRLFEAARHAVGLAMGALEEGAPVELAVIDLQEAMDALDEITGTRVRMDVLDSVFSRFCIGK